MTIVPFKGGVLLGRLLRGKATDNLSVTIRSNIRALCGYFLYRFQLVPRILGLVPLLGGLFSPRRGRKPRVCPGRRPIPISGKSNLLEYVVKPWYLVPLY